jgi:hypothetical protein
MLHRMLSRLGVIVVTGFLSSAAVAAESGPFAGFNGVWTGSGHIKLADGSQERIRCRATYAESNGGRALQQALRCASDSYNFELRGDVESHGNQISGNWNETTRNVGGTLSGRAQPGRFEVRIDNPSFSAELTLVSRNNTQTVTIRSSGTTFSGASVSLRRTSQSVNDRERLAVPETAGRK